RDDVREDLDPNYRWERFIILARRRRASGRKWNDQQCVDRSGPFRGERTDLQPGFSSVGTRSDGDVWHWPAHKIDFIGIGVHEQDRIAEVHRTGEVTRQIRVADVV